MDWSMALVGAVAASSILSALAPTWLALMDTVGWVLGYFTAGYMSRGTIGMRIMGIHPLGARSGCRLGMGRALSRAVLALATVSATLLVLALFVISDRPDGGYTPADMLVGGGALALCIAAFVGELRLLVGDGSSLQDRVLGITWKQEPRR
jgi:hypothetical protein